MARGVTDREREVVCAVLSGASSKGAVRVAARLAERLSLRLALIDVHVPIPPPQAAPLEAPQPVVPFGPAVGVPPLPGDEIAVVQGPAEWRREVAMAPDTREDTMTAAPAMALERLAQDPRTALLVVGDEGGGPLRAKLEGNAGRSVLSDVRCPVVLVPRRRAGTTDEADIATVLCGVDDDGAAPAVAVAAASLAERLGARLRIVHVLERSLSGAPPEPVAPSQLGGDGRNESERLFATCRAALPPHAAAEFVTVDGDAAEGLRSAAREVDAGLIVVARPRHGAVGSALLGSVMHQLLRTGTTPICVIPR